MTDLGNCPFCGRKLVDGSSINRHHLVPRSRQGRATVQLHRVCHAAIHAALSEKELERQYDSIERLRDHLQLRRSSSGSAPSRRNSGCAPADRADIAGASRMPLQNRVTPFGDIVAIPQRGMFTGNRGIIHDPTTRTLLKRRWTTKAWLICLCDFKGRRRTVMGGRSWTELFFLDEAVALAAGHRPCFFCRREAAMAFRRAWAAGRAVDAPPAPAMDAVLHDERLDRGGKRLHPLPSDAAELPDGAVIAAAGEAYTLAQGSAFRWTPHGYAGPAEIPRAAALLTPPSTLGALRAGYRPVLHPGIAAMLTGTDV